ncbi:hypothetical protein C8F01DRAFT_1361044 [Mycena amicta]|nr:hypothetical protein C8F01DRAFT_1361044 [Mycena amicta]
MLPTPPRTAHKRKRASRGFTDDSDDDNSNAESKAKRVRDAQAEESFWLSNHLNASPLSPPPSHRKLQRRRTASPPHTPTPPPKRTKLLPRDSPDNPFLASPIGPKDDIVVTSDPVSREEKPTMAFVFRGVRRSFPNPYYGKAPNPHSELPPEHPDYEPDDSAFPPKLLFGSKTRRTAEPARQPKGE